MRRTEPDALERASAMSYAIAGILLCRPGRRQMR